MNHFLWVMKILNGRENSPSIKNKIQLLYIIVDMLPLLVIGLIDILLGMVLLVIGLMEILGMVLLVIGLILGMVLLV